MNRSTVAGIVVLGTVAQGALAREAGWQVGGFLALQSRETEALKQPWALASAELGADWESPHGLGLTLNMALDEHGAVPAMVAARWQALEMLALSAGRQDLPFARDRFWFAAPDRPCIHAPLCTEQGLEGGLGADALVASLALPAGFGLESWAGRPVFTDREWSRGLRTSLSGETLELGLSLHHETAGVRLLAGDLRLGGVTGEWLVRDEQGQPRGRGGHLEVGIDLPERWIGTAGLLAGIETWRTRNQPDLDLARLALSREFAAGPIARIEQRITRSAGESRIEHHLQLVLPL